MFAYLEISGETDTVFGKTTGEVKLMAIKKKKGNGGQMNAGRIKKNKRASIKKAKAKRKMPVKHNGNTQIA